MVRIGLDKSSGCGKEGKTKSDKHLCIKESHIVRTISDAVDGSLKRTHLVMIEHKYNYCGKEP